MAANHPPEITLELTGSALTIRTAEAVYRIVVTGAAAQAQAALPAAEAPKALQGSSEPAMDDWDDLDLGIPAPPPPSPEPQLIKPSFDPTKETVDTNEYYRDLSHDMYREIGTLAKRLSMSIRNVSTTNFSNMDLTSTGQQLEVAKGELQDVVKMTEQATMRIMDMGESIQNQVDRTQKLVERLAPIKEMAQAGSEARDEAGAKLAELLGGLDEYLGRVSQGPLGELAEQAQGILDQMRSAAEAPADVVVQAPPPKPAGPYFRFPLDVVFQTVYELCTNEAVKKHIKTMWDTPAEFNGAELEAALNEITPKQPDADNFLNIDLKQVLRALFKATANEKFQGVLKKMAQTSDQIFLDQFLPLEAMPGQAPPRPEPEPAAPEPATAALPPEILEHMDALSRALEQANQALEPPAVPESLSQLLETALGEHGGACNVIEPDLLHQLTEAEESIRVAVNTIIESLSFQDLSGQTIYRIVRLLSEFQVQLLAMVVSFGSKLKAKERRQEITVDESEKLAQEEVDRVLAGLGGGAAHAAPPQGAEGQKGEAESDEDKEQLDQDAVNNLLEALGF